MYLNDAIPISCVFESLLVLVYHQLYVRKYYIINVSTQLGLLTLV